MAEGGMPGRDALPPALDRLNRLPAAEARAELLRCCGSSQWASRMASARPFESAGELFRAADRAWRKLGPPDWLEAFRRHPRIGDLKSLKAKFAKTGAWASQEQSGVRGAPAAILKALADGNRSYERRFGRIFLVCATGKSALDLLGLLRERLLNDTRTELRIAAGEQAKITRIRLENLMNPKSPITTHVLDTARGRPAAGVPVTLEFRSGRLWKELARGRTDANGRIAGLLPEGSLKKGTYRMSFDTGAYFRAKGGSGFYPYVQVVFEIRKPQEHHHIPLLLSPYGYSTYRGS